MKKPKAIIAGPSVMELGWEILRFAPHIIWQKNIKHKKEVKLIVITRPDRFDLYGKHADIFIPLHIKGDSKEKFSDCWRLTGLPNKDYQQIISNFKNNLSNEYNIIDQIYPKIDKRRFVQKNQFNRKQMRFNFLPRDSNYKLVEKVIPNDKPLIALGPRFRRHNRLRNWPHWKTFYNLIHSDKFFNEYNFIICGKPPEYVPDGEKRFYDINDIPLEKDTSLIGVTIVLLMKSIITIGSQSAIPNLSNLVGTETIQWGNQKREHEVQYNVKKTPTTFIVDKKFKLDPKDLITITKKKLRRKKDENGK
jgi:hypothetical protein